MTIADDILDGLMERHRPAIQAHCYRMLGSFHDAEDATQETMLRAWRARESFRGDAKASTWIHGIATHVCLDALRRTGRSRAVSVAAMDEIPWLTPMPLVETDIQSIPHARVEASEATRLAFVRVMQTLPARQRACVLLKDVLDWSSTEIAATLGTSEAAVNSALQRARLSLSERTANTDDDKTTSAVVAQWIERWNSRDIAGLAQLLAADAAMEMPPEGTLGFPDAILDFITPIVIGAARASAVLVPARFSHLHGIAAYWVEPGAAPIRYGLMVIESQGALVRRIHACRDQAVLAALGLHEELTTNGALGTDELARLTSTH